MSTPITTEEKMEVATAYVKKMRKLMAVRLGLIAFFSLIFLLIPLIYSIFTEKNKKYIQTK